MELCRFEADDESRIYVDTWTLATPTPTLASVAYLAKVQNEPDPPGATRRPRTARLWAGRRASAPARQAAAG